MSQDALSAFWDQFKMAPWEDEWLFFPDHEPPQPPDLALDLPTIETFRVKIQTEAGPYGPTNPASMDSFLAMFLLPFVERDRSEMVRVLASAMKREDLRSLAIETLSIYFAKTGSPDRWRSPGVTAEERELIQRGLTSLPVAHQDRLNAETLTTALGL